MNRLVRGTPMLECKLLKRTKASPKTLTQLICLPIDLEGRFIEYENADDIQTFTLGMQINTLLSNTRSSTGLLLSYYRSWSEWPTIQSMRRTCLLNVKLTSLAHVAMGRARLLAGLYAWY